MDQEKKVSNRRYRIWWTTISLITFMFLLILILNKPLEWFIEYSKPVLWAGVAIGLGLTATDAVFTWKR